MVIILFTPLKEKESTETAKIRASCLDYEAVSNKFNGMHMLSEVSVKPEDRNAVF
jgi:hypothetical protein